MSMHVRDIRVVGRAQPFAGPVLECLVPPGTSLEDIVACHVDLPRDLLGRIVVCIDDEPVPRALWRQIKPKAGRCLVSFHVPLERGNQTLATVAQIIVVVAALVIGNVVGGAVGGGALGSIASAVVSTAIAYGGQLAISALVGPPQLQGSAQAFAGAEASGAAGNNNAASLTGNVLRPGGDVPWVIGTHRVFPPLACQPLVETVGDDQVAEAVFILNGPHAISDIRSGNVSADDIEELETEICDGKQESDIQTLVRRQGFTHNANLELSRHKVDLTTQTSLLDQNDPESDLPQWHSFVSRVAPDEIWINLVWPQGLFVSDVAGAATNQAFRVRFRQRGATDWINCPEIHFSHNRIGTVQKSIRLIWDDMPSAPAIPPTGFGPVYAYNSVAEQSAVTPPRGGWTAADHFFDGSGDHVLSNAIIDTSSVANTELQSDRAILYLDAEIFPQDGVYEVQVMASQAYRDSTWSAADYTVSSTLYDLFGYYTSSGTHRTINDQSKYLSRVAVNRFSSVWNENPIQTRDFAHVAARVTNRSLDQFSLLASGYVLDWNEASPGAWDALTTTSNPAAWLRDVYGGRYSADPIPAAIIDDDELVDWRDHCTTQGYACDMVVEGGSQDAVATAIAACGFAKPRKSEKFGVIVDRDVASESPAQIFSPRNMNGFRFSRGYPKRPDGFRVRFDDLDDDYQEREIVVLDPAAGQNFNSLRLEDIRYDGIVTEAAARARALFDLKQAHFRFTFYSGTVRSEILRCRRGDLVAVQHDLLSPHDAGYAYIASVTKSGGNVTGLVLDGSIPVPSEDAFTAGSEAFASYDDAFIARRAGIAIRCLDGTILTGEITAAGEETATVSFVTPFADPGTAVLDEGCLLVSGTLSREYSRMKVFDIDYQKNLTANVTLVPEAPELWPLDVFAPADIFGESNIFQNN